MEPLFRDMESAAGHDLDEYDEHNPEECYKCLAAMEPALSSCRCAECCRLLIEVRLEDAEREPKIRERGSPIYTDARLTASGQRELAGYMLNSPDNDYACAFLDRASNLCTIHETRPLLCRLFNCDGEGREQLIELGILDRGQAPANESPSSRPSSHQPELF